ncbi:hypothetical protein CBS101457_005604 [Exobasidium rhododendri]|nr:hypothetical protein CBS101457_005604 [Exobasidium rhododendri]
MLLLVALMLTLIRPSEAQVAAQNRLLQSDAIVPMKTHSIYSPYVDSDLQNKFWDFGGDAIIDTNRAVLLTQDRSSQAGWLWSRLPLSVPNYEITGEFKIDGKAAKSHPYGDGFAFWLTEDRAQGGNVFGSKDYFTGLGIMFDTFANARHPYTFPRIMAVRLNGVESYRMDKDGATQELAGCSLDIRRAKVATRFRFTYVKDVFAELAIHYEEWDTWETCFKLGNLTVPANPFVGFSAMTGDVSDTHEIISVATNNIVYKQRSKKELLEAKKYHLGDAKAGKKASKKFGSWFGSGGSSSSSSSSSTSDSGGHAYNGNAGGNSFKRFFMGLFSFAWVMFKWGSAISLVGVAVYAYFMRKKKYDAKRF